MRKLSVRPPVNLQPYISLTKTSEHRACTRMSHGSNQEKRVKVTEICMFTMTRRNSSKWSQRQKPNDPQIILGIRVMRQTGIQHSDDIMGYPNNYDICVVAIEGSGLENSCLF